MITYYLSGDVYLHPDGIMKKKGKRNLTRSRSPKISFITVGHMRRAVSRSTGSSSSRSSVPSVSRPGVCCFNPVSFLSGHNTCIYCFSLRFCNAVSLCSVHRVDGLSAHFQEKASCYICVHELFGLCLSISIMYVLLCHPPDW